MVEKNEEDLSNGFTDSSQALEYSPGKRFSRNSRLIAEGKYKKVYMGYDHDNGREVSWNSLNISSFTQANKERIKEDLQIFSQIEHPSFLKVIKSWHESQDMELVIITELVTCSLKQFVRNKLKTTRGKVVKMWIKTILNGLKHIHGMQIIHGSVKSENLFVSSSDSGVRIGLFNSLDKTRSNSKNHDFRSLSYVLTEICTKVDLNYSLLFKRNLPKQVEMISNDRFKGFITSCFSENEAENLLNHEFLLSDDRSDSVPVEIKEIEDVFDVFIEKGTSGKCCVLVFKNEKTLSKIEFILGEDVAESLAERIMTDCKLPENLFFEILEKIEDFFNTENKIKEKESYQNFKPASIMAHYRDPSFQDITPISAMSNPFSCLSEHKVPQKLSINIEVKDISHCKKFKIDLDYDAEIDSPKKIAQQIVFKFSLDQSETSTIAKLITEKLGESSSETHSNYSNQDLLDLTEETHFKPHLNSTNEVSLPSEASSLRSNSPLKEEDLRLICGKSLKNDPKEVRQVQEALSLLFGVRFSNDGMFCLATEKQIKRFQEENGLTPTGVVCERLWDCIMIKAKTCRNVYH